MDPIGFVPFVLADFFHRFTGEYVGKRKSDAFITKLFGIFASKFRVTDHGIGGDVPQASDLTHNVAFVATPVGHKEIIGTAILIEDTSPETGDLQFFGSVISTIPLSSWHRRLNVSIAGDFH